MTSDPDAFEEAVFVDRALREVPVVRERDNAQGLMHTCISLVCRSRRWTSRKPRTMTPSWLRSARGYAASDRPGFFFDVFRSDLYTGSCGSEWNYPNWNQPQIDREIDVVQGNSAHGTTVGS